MFFGTPNLGVTIQHIRLVAKWRARPDKVKHYSAQDVLSFFVHSDEDEGRLPIVVFGVVKMKRDAAFLA